MISIPISLNYHQNKTSFFAYVYRQGGAYVSFPSVGEKCSSIMMPADKNPLRAVF